MPSYYLLVYIYANINKIYNNDLRIKTDTRKVFQ